MPEILIMNKKYEEMTTISWALYVYKTEIWLINVFVQAKKIYFREFFLNPKIQWIRTNYSIWK